ncbi:MAG: flagellar hook-associated protein 2 [Ruminiclostridium sp.]|nr:flagellar hook-associated protein 2 [Ruminiclostridium sp.]
MTVNNIASYTSRFRLSGLGGSGLDTDTVVTQLMNVEKIPINKLYQKKQLAEWKRDDYRSITNLLRGLKDEFFDVLKPSTNMLSQSSYKKYTGTSTDDTIVTVAGNSSSIPGSHTISVTSIATAGKAESSSGVTDPLEGNAVSDYNLSGKTLEITLDGITRDITLDNYSYVAGAPSTSDIVAKASTGLQALVDTAFGSGKITVTYDGNTEKLEFANAGGASKITLTGGTALDKLGFTADASNRLDTSKSLSDLSTAFATDLTFNGSGELKFTINSTRFTFDQSVSLSSMFNTINTNSDVNVNIQYDETTDKIVITSKQLGYGDNIIIDAAAQEGNFFGAAGASAINTGSATTSQGVDADVEIDGQTLIRSSNTFTVNGVTYNLLKAHTDPAAQSETVSLSLDVDSIYNNIKSFVDKYNDIISTINTKLGEKYDREYPPLTDEQKADMEAEDIKKWEDKAKTGLLRNDQLLQGIVYNMRQALSDSIGDVTINLSSIGITTSDYTEQGKLIIDETELKEAISNNPEAVSELFTKASGTDYSSSLTSGERTQRYEEEGLAYRLSDILNDYIRTTDGKGLLLERAGMEDDRTEYSNSIYTEIDNYNDRISELLEKLSDKENKYYAKFTAMEQAISRMNAQSNWLSSQLGGSG